MHVHSDHTRPHCRVGDSGIPACSTRYSHHITPGLCLAILGESCHQAGAAEAHKLQWAQMAIVGLALHPLEVKNGNKEAHDTGHPPVLVNSGG